MSVSALERAMALHRAGALGRALAAYQDLLAADPANADALHLTGVLAHQMGRTSVGIACIEQALQLNPRAPLYHRNMAELRKATGDHARAAAHLRQAAALDPANVDTRIALGLALAADGDIAGAIESYRAALALDPACAAAHANLGLALEETGDVAGAEAAYRSALSARPDFVPALNNLAMLLGEQNAVEAAIALLRRAIAVDPGNAEAGVNLGQLLLLTGNLREGWRLLEARRRVPDALHPPAGVREWAGPGDPCRRLLVCAEQGLGEELLFASCLADLAAAQPRTTLVVECDPRLAPLFGRSFPACEIRPYRLTETRRRSSRRDWLAEAPVDAYVPAGTLPLHFRSARADYPATAGYLVADPQRVRHWRAWLAQAAGSRITVGLCWRSGTRGGIRDTRALPLPAWEPLLRDPRIAVVNLQYGEAGPALVSHAQTIGAPVLEAPGLDLFDGLDDLAALMTALDAVVSAPTAVCELAGALGRPTWRTLRGNDWSRLGGTGGVCPWHPNTRIVAGEPSTPPEQVIAALLTSLFEAESGTGKET